MRNPAVEMNFQAVRLAELKPVLNGNKIRLERLSAEHVSQHYADWFNDPLVTRFTRHGSRHYSLRDVTEYIQTLQDSNTTLVFAIIRLSDGQHIGNISLNDISWANRSGEISILLGDRSSWGQGIGRESVRMVMDFAFSSLLLHRVWLGMTTDNLPMIRIAEKLGFHHEGIFKEALFKNGCYYNITQWARLSPFGIETPNKGSLE